MLTAETLQQLPDLAKGLQRFPPKVVLHPSQQAPLVNVDKEQA